MKNKKSASLLIVVISLNFVNLHAQQTIASAGGNASGSGGSASYSVGQIVYKTQNGSSGSVAQGVQQAYEISIVSLDEQSQGVNLLLSAFPNPASDFLTLKIESNKTKNLSYRLMDINGKLLLSRKISELESSISLANFTTGSYFLEVTDEYKNVKSFKIVKN